MRRKRKLKNNFMLCVFVLVFFSISIGYSMLNSNLNITGVSRVQKNIWDVHFENILINEGSIEAVTAPELSDDTLCNFDVTLATPGDFYEFTIDVVNDGTIDAMLGDFSISPTLTDTQKEYLIYTVEYQNGEVLQKNQLIKSGEFVRIKVHIEYRSDLLLENLPATDDILNMSLNLSYVQSDETAIDVYKNGLLENVFIFDGNEYAFVEGMTWREFLESEYNSEEIFVIGTIDNEEVVVHQAGIFLTLLDDGSGNINFVYLDDIIITGYEYQQFVL